MSDYENVNTTPDYGNVKADYTPTTEEVRHAILYVVERLEYQGHPLPGGVEGFDRWLASVKAEAWDEACDHLEIECDHNPYREVTHLTKETMHSAPYFDGGSTNDD